MSTNDPFKEDLKKQFSSWFVKKVKELFNNGQTVYSVKVDLHISSTQPVHCQWLNNHIAWISQQEGMPIFLQI